MLGCEDAETPGTQELQQAGLFAQMTQVLQAVSVQYPLILLLDDVQWADQDSLNLLFHLGRRLVGQRVLLIGAFRSDVFHPDAATASYLPEPNGAQRPSPPRHPLVALVNELQHRRGDIRIDLAQASGRAFIDALVDSEPNHLGATFRETLYRHTNGQALFTTELLRGMQARGDLVRNAQGYWVEGERIVWDALPAKVEGVIAQRVDQLLPEWQALLTVASVEGDAFTVQVVAQILDLPEREVSRRLSGALSRHHYLVTPVGVQQIGAQTGVHALARYRFRHQLFQRYLYHRLDAVELAQLHLRVGQTLEGLYEEHAPEISLALARHFELGGDVAKTVAYLLHAGQRANRLAATEEAMRLLTHGLTLCQHLPPSSARQQQEADLHLALGNALLAKGWDSDERAEVSARAYALSQRVGDLGQVARSLVMMAEVPMGRGQLPQLTTIGEQLQALAQHPQIAASESLTAQLALYVDYVWGSLYFFQGDLLAAREHLTHVSSTLDAPPDTLVETTLRAMSHVWLVYTLWLLGYPDQAFTCSQRTLAAVSGLDYALPLQLALSIGKAGAHYLRREPRAMQAALAQLAALDDGASLAVFQPWVLLFEGWLMAVDQHNAAGLDRMHQAIQLWEEEAGSQGGMLLQYTLLIEGYLALGQTEAALTPLDAMLDFIDATDFRAAEAEFVRLKGEAWQALGQPDEAEACFQRARTIARAQLSKIWELRAAMSLCRLHQATGQVAQLAAARAQLAEVYDWFTEGLDTADLQEAAALLAETQKR
jgi:tetratricopeptide (TPR) repeat protein